MITCPNCGSENLVGAIFCRTCGKKLDLEHLRPETMMAKGDSVTKKMGGVLGRMVLVLVAIVLITVLVVLLLPVSGRVNAYLDDEALAQLEAKYMFLVQPSAEHPEVTLSSEELTVALNAILGLETYGANAQPPIKPSSGGSLVPDHLSVEARGNGTVRLVLKALLFGKIPTYSTIVARVDVGDEGLVFHPRSAAVGRLPLPGGVQEMVVQRFEALFYSKTDLADLQKRIRALDLGDNSVTFRVM